MRPKTCNSKPKNARNQSHTAGERRKQPKLDAQRMGLALARRRKVPGTNWLLSGPGTRRRRPNETQSDVGISLDRWQARDYGQESDHENADRSAGSATAKGPVRSAPEARSDQVDLTKARPATLALAREKMPFEITPFFPRLTRMPSEGADKMAMAAGGSK